VTRKTGDQDAAVEVIELTVPKDEVAPETKNDPPVTWAEPL
jgi:hypothetical protein